MEAANVTYVRNVAAPAPAARQKAPSLISYMIYIICDLHIYTFYVYCSSI